MKCKKCNTENSDDANFCKGCGMKITCVFEKNTSKKTDLFLFFALFSLFVGVIIWFVAVRGGVCYSYNPLSNFLCFIGCFLVALSITNKKIKIVSFIIVGFIMVQLFFDLIPMMF